MEHRWSTRRPHRCSVVVHHAGIDAARGRSRDIGPDGMFIETGDLPLPVNTVVAVAFRLGRLDFRLAAMVVHRLTHGAGVMFLEADSETSRVLRAALAEAPAAGPWHGGIPERDAA